MVGGVAVDPSDDLLEFLRWQEGLPGGKPALVAYQDKGGVWTIGYGRTKNVSTGDRCSPEQAEAWLYQDASHFMHNVLAMVAIELTRYEVDACTSLAFNIGSAGFSGSQVLKYINQGKLVSASQAFGLWNKVHVDGELVVSDDLVQRRAAERAIFDRGDYSGRP
jgi:lysozyme